MTSETKREVVVDITNKQPTELASSDDGDDRLAAEQAAIDRAYEHDENGVLRTSKMDVFYGDFRAVADVSLSFPFNEISALIGPSGCGKSTVLRSLNRMNDLIPSARVVGEGQDVCRSVHRRAQGIPEFEWCVGARIAGA